MAVQELYSRDYIVKKALEWEGTPYLHQAYLKGVGADCLGLIRGLYIELYGRDPEDRPRYSPQWGESTKDEKLLEAANKYLNKININEWRAGDILVFRIKNSYSAKHCAIVVDSDNIVHALARKSVCVTTLGPWKSRIAGAFQFPGVK